ncbi:winged helix-turn-helix domain-containing protein [Candidatus Bathyarchaeota archaeon]|nr:winged helix-turn-helix domain-containing protein [Candidatus Bathyarchaeota archaeon]
MSNSGKEPYSIMFSSLKHPSRRKILRMLAEKPRNFSKIEEGLGISSSNLTYHLENLGELLTKMDDGRYKLSTLGEAAVTTMKGVEETPDIKTKSPLSLPLKWKSLFAVLMMGLIILAGLSYAQFASFNHLSSAYQEISAEHDLLESEFARISADNERLLSWGKSPTKVLSFLKDVIHLDITKYHSTLASNTVEYRNDLGGIVEELFKYTLAYDGSKVDVTLRFRNNELSRFYLYVLEGAPVYSELQPTNVLDVSKGIIERYSEYSGASYLEDIKNLLEPVNETGDFETTSGNVKIIKSTEGNKVKIQCLYTENSIDFQSKSVVLSFDTYGFLEGLNDDWSIFNVSSTEVNISKEEAITIAMEYAKSYSWTVNGVTINNFTIVSDPSTAELWPHSREEPLDLIPYWYVTLHLDRVYPERVDRLAVGLWADTGEVSTCQTLSW